jgi:hypothetical protein
MHCRYLGEGGGLSRIGVVNLTSQTNLAIDLQKSCFREYFGKGEMDCDMVVILFTDEEIQKDEEGWQGDESKWY